MGFRVLGDFKTPSFKEETLNNIVGIPILGVVLVFAGMKGFYRDLKCLTWNKKVFWGTHCKGINV